MTSVPVEVQSTRVYRWRAVVGSGPVLPTAASLWAFAVSLIALDTPSVWKDEAATISAATRTLPELFAMLAQVDAVHGLYYLIMHVVFEVFGYSPMTLRMPSAIAVGATAALLVVIGRQLGHGRVGLVAAVILPLIPRVNWMASEGRSSSLSALLAAALTVVLLRAISTGAARWAVLYAVTAGVAILLFVYLALIVFAHVLAHVALWRSHRVPVAAITRWSLATLLATVSVAPVVAAIYSQRAQVEWLSALSLSTVRGIFVTQWFDGSWPFAAIAWALIALATIGLVRRHDTLTLSAVIIPLVAPTALVIAASVVTPLYTPRYLAMCTPFVALAMALGVSWIRSRWVRAALVVAACIASVPAIVGNRVVDAKGESWSTVAEVIRDDRAAHSTDRPSAMIFGERTRLISLAYPDAFTNTVDVTLARTGVETSHLWSESARLRDTLGRMDGTGSAYLVAQNHSEFATESTQRLVNWGWQVTASWVVDDLIIERLERASR